MPDTQALAGVNLPTGSLAQPSMSWTRWTSTPGRGSSVYYGKLRRQRNTAWRVLYLIFWALRR